LRLAAALALGAFVFILGLTGCSGFFTAIKSTGATTGSTTYVYVTNIGTGGNGGSIAAYSLTGGVLTALSGSPITLTATPTSIVVAPNNAFLYVGTSLGVFLYTIGTDGTLTEGNDNTIVYLGPTFPESLAVDSTSSWLFVANNKSTELDALPISPTTGIPTSPTPASVTLTNASPAQVKISPANTTVAVALGSGGANVFPFTATTTTPWGKTGTLIDLGTKSTAANAVAFDNTSTYLFIAESTSNTSTDILREITLSTLGTTAVAETDYPTGKGPSAILPDLSSAYVYVTNQTDNTISAFALSAGALTPLTDSPFATAKGPLAIAEDSTKSYILDVGNGTNPNLWLYKFDTTTSGSLDVGTTISTGTADPALSNAIALTH
jgi:6-phosphogluconolactonase (cycloisomerase 2 family)